MSTTSLASPDKKTIRQLFDSVATRYDLINTFLSFRLDDLWRKRAKDLILEGTEDSILDLGVGTGKFLQYFLNAKSWKQVTGLDFSQAMLKEAEREQPDFVCWVNADFHDLPFQDETFDLIISSYTLRSVQDLPRFLSEVSRILTERGKAAFLCLTRPQNAFWKIIYYPYLKWYLPLIGRMISGDEIAYQFLSQSIQTFQNPTKTIEMMCRTGFRSIESRSFTFGAATLIIGRK